MADDHTKSPGSGAPAPAPRAVEPGKRQLIVASRRGSQAAAALRPMSAMAVRALLGQVPGVEIARTLRARRAVSALSRTPDESSEVYVVRIDADRADLIAQMAPPQLAVEEDAALGYASPVGLPEPPPTRLGAWSSGGTLETRQIRLHVRGEGDKPVANAGVSLTGEGFPQEARTDKRGDVTLPLVALPGRRARSLFVSAPSGHWDLYLTEPELSDGEVNAVRLRPIEETIAGFPHEFRYGWGQLQLGLDHVPEAFAGAGVKIAIIDSGADTSHPLLRHIRHGADFTGGADPQGWTQDAVGHGSHAAGIIAARDESGRMLRGFAPEAEIHVLKVFPGGQISSLVEALDYCIERDIDVVNLSLASPRWSPVVEQKLEEAALLGIACIAAAGSSGGAVQYPATSPYTLAVGAIGRLNEYPDRTWDRTAVVPSLVAGDGIFAPAFGARGPEIAVCAPGVAIVSTVPGGFEPRSGTSAAAAHVTGLAALVLAHHPAFQAAFQGPLQARGPQRVAALFGLIQSLAVPVGLDPLRTGAGLPRLHGLARVLKASAPVRGGKGNGQPAAVPVAPAISGLAYGQSLGGMVAPLPTAYGPGFAEALDPVQVGPLYVQASILTSAWPVQALLESLRRQYLGN